MNTNCFTKEQCDHLAGILSAFSGECGTSLVMLCDIAGNIIAHTGGDNAQNLENMAALATGSFTASRELSNMVGESGFKAIVHRGKQTGILMQALAGGFLVVVLFEKNGVEGLIRLCLKKMAAQLESVLIEK